MVQFFFKHPVYKAVMSFRMTIVTDPWLISPCHDMAPGYDSNFTLQDESSPCAACIASLTRQLF